MSHPLFAWGSPSGPDMFIIAVLVLVLFGAGRPPFPRGLGGFRRTREDWRREMLETASLNRKLRHEDPDEFVNAALFYLFAASLLILILSLISPDAH